jgi:hemin uptake protein HemP
MSSKRQKDEETWARIQESLDGFQPAHLAAHLREHLVPHIPRSATRLDERTRQNLFEGVSALLAEHAGAWYTLARVRLGNPVLGGYSRSSSFFNQGHPPDLGVESNIQRILSALGVAHAWLCTLDTYFRSVALPPDEEDRVAVLSDAVRRVIALTVEATGCEEDWHLHAHLALGWLLESQGLPRTERLKRALDAALVDFTRGTPPLEDETRRAANLLARAAVKEAGSRPLTEEEEVS